MLLYIKFVQIMRPQCSPDSCAFKKYMKEARNRIREVQSTLCLYRGQSMVCGVKEQFSWEAPLFSIQ